MLAEIRNYPPRRADSLRWKHENGAPLVLHAGGDKLPLQFAPTVLQFNNLAIWF